MSETINRDAGDKAKGPRLQRLRAISGILAKIADASRIHTCCATEAGDDVVIESATCDSSETIHEQDKDHPSAGNFSFAHKEVLSGVTGFIDAWVKANLSPSVYFQFYATNEIGNEASTAAIKAAHVDLPEKPILQRLQQGDTDNKLLEAVKYYVLTAYAASYEKRKTDGNYALIEAWNDDRWRDFLSRIEWRFGQENAEDLETKVREQIRESQWFTVQHDGKDDLVLGVLLDAFDKRQTASDFAHRFVGQEFVELAFKMVASGESRGDDPAAEMWGAIEVVDGRGAEEKFRAVAPSVDSHRLERFHRGITLSLIEQNGMSVTAGKRLLAEKYQIYDACLEYIDTMLLPNLSPPVQPEVLDDLLNQVFAMAQERIDNVSRDYVYPLTNGPSIKNLVLELFNSCYLDLDRGQGAQPGALRGKDEEEA